MAAGLTNIRANNTLSDTVKHCASCDADIRIAKDVPVVNGYRSFITVLTSVLHWVIS